MNLPILADENAASDWDGIVCALLEDKVLGECSDLWISPGSRASAVKDAVLERKINSRVPHCSVPLITGSFSSVVW